jgi:hypothetical protein
MSSTAENVSEREAFPLLAYVRIYGTDREDLNNMKGWIVAVPAAARGGGGGDTEAAAKKCLDEAPYSVKCDDCDGIENVVEVTPANLQTF